jgi:predicted nucleic acid-binding protein
MIVLDASATVEWLLQGSTGLRIENRVYSRNESLHSPHLLDVEVLQVLRRLVGDKVVRADRAGEAIQDLRDLRVVRYPHFVMLNRMWQLRHTLSTYDAAYVALAEALDAPLLTCDARIASASGHHANVEVQ